MFALRARFSFVLLTILALSLVGCGGGGGEGSADTGTRPDTTAPGPGSTDSGPGALTPDQGSTPTVPVTPAEQDAAVTAFLTELQAALAENEGVTVAELRERHAVPASLSASEITFDAMAAEHMDAVVEFLDLDDGEKESLRTHGFVLAGEQRYASYADAYLAIYRNHLPVVLTTDSVLHALHRSFDTILQGLETATLSPELGRLLDAMHGAWEEPANLDDAELAAAWDDVDVYLTVARSLLDGSTVDTRSDANSAEAGRILGLAAAEQFVTTTIFERERKMDFSQMKPRGHYTLSEELTRYFRAMMWLGRVDFRPVDQPQNAMDQGLELVRRQLLGAIIVSDLIEASGERATWDGIDGLLGAMIGRRDSMGPPGMRAFLDGVDVSDAADAATRDPAQLEVALVKSGMGQQRIRSHWIETDPFAEEMAPLPVSFLVLGQRFTVDSHVFSNVVYDSIVHEGQKVERVLPSPLDALFALGNDSALPLLSDELARFPYQANLSMMRWYMDGYDEAFWSESVYSGWLSSLRAMNPASVDPNGLPEAMRTIAWQRKVMNTQLASWAELRHDTLLYAKQSYTGGIACAYPAGYVEPYPEIYGRIASVLTALGDLLEVAPGDQQAWTVGKLERMAEILGQLQVMAVKELDGEPFDEAELELMRTLIDADPGCGDPVFFGWYAELFASGGANDRDLIIADVHTNPNQGPLPGPNVLHVATGDVHMMTLAVDTCDGPMAFVGPVKSFYEVDVPKIERLTDEEWAQREKPAIPSYLDGLWPRTPDTSEVQSGMKDPFN